jgi:hypothetical protein
MPELFSVEATLASLMDMEALLRQVGNHAPHAIRRAVNRTGDKALTLVTRTLAKQTGVKYRVVKRSLSVQRANYDRGTYRISSKGGYISLKEFDARQTKNGVSAMVWDKRRVFPHSFIAPTLGGHVFVRMGKGRNPIRKMWGPALPAELVKDETAAIFLSTVETELPQRLAHEVGALLAGHAARS